MTTTTTRNLSDFDRYELKEMLKAATAGDAAAQFDYAVEHLTGKRVDVDHKKALHWFKKASTTGDADALTEVARMTEEGLGTDVDLTSAAATYRKAVARGSVRAMVRLGLMLRDGRGVERVDSAAARQLFETALASKSNAQNAKQSLGEAAYQLGMMNLIGMGSDRRRRSNRVDDDGTVEDDDDAATRYDRFDVDYDAPPGTSKGGSASKPSRVTSARAYDYSESVVENDDADNAEEAAAMFRRAVEYGNVAAAFELSMLLDGSQINRSGVGLDANRTEALRLLTLAAEGGYVAAQERLAMSYESNQRGGVVAHRNVPLAIQWYKRAHATGHSSIATLALRRLGVIDELGNEIPTAKAATSAASQRATAGVPADATETAGSKPRQSQCAVCGSNATMHCGGCLATRNGRPHYCSRRCQVQHWRDGHDKQCDRRNEKAL